LDSITRIAKTHEDLVSSAHFLRGWMDRCKLSKEDADTILFLVGVFMEYSGQNKELRSYPQRTITEILDGMKNCYAVVGGFGGVQRLQEGIVRTALQSVSCRNSPSNVLLKRIRMLEMVASSL